MAECTDLISREDLENAKLLNIHLAEVISGQTALGVVIQNSTNPITGVVVPTLISIIQGAAGTPVTYAAGAQLTTFSDYFIINNVSYRALPTTPLPFTATGVITTDLNYLTPFDNGWLATEQATIATEQANIATQQANNSAGSAAQSDASRVLAEQAVLDASLNSGIYETVSAGIAATTVGDLFNVISQFDDGFLDLYKNDAGVGVYQGKTSTNTSIVDDIKLQSDGYLLFYDFELTAPAAGFTYNDELRELTIANGTTNVNANALLLPMTSIGTINSAIEQGVLSISFEMLFECTINIGVNINIVSDQRNVNIPAGNWLNGVFKVFDLALLPGEVLSSLSVVCRFSVTTATQELKLKVKSALVYSSDAVVSKTLRNAYLGDVIVQYQNSSNQKFNPIEVGKSDYLVGANPSSFGEKIYRGIILDPAVAITAAANVAVVLGSDQSYANGSTLRIEVILSCNVDISTILNASFTPLGGDLYLYKKEISNFDSNVSNKIYNFIQCKTTTTSVETSIVIEAVLVEPTSTSQYDAATTKLTRSLNKPTVVNVGLTLGTYAEKYRSLVTAMHSLLDGTLNQQYNVEVDSGLYDITDMLDYNDIVDQVPFKRGVELAQFVNLYGYEGTILNCKYVFGDARMDQAKYQAISPLNFLGSNKLRNLQVFAENCRYAVHDDGNLIDDAYVETDNCIFEHLGNDPLINWQADGGYISGFRTGKVAVFNRTKMKGRRGFSVHESNVMLRPIEAEFNDCEITSTNEFSFQLLSEYTNNTVNKISLNNTQINGKAQVKNSATGKVWDLNGSGNTLVPYESFVGMVRHIPSFADQDTIIKNSSVSTVNEFKPVKKVNGTFIEFAPSDNVSLFGGVLMQTTASDALGSVRYAGYIEDSLLGLTAIAGDTLALDGAVFTLNGTNVIGLCDYDGFFKLN